MPADPKHLRALRRKAEKLLLEAPDKLAPMSGTDLHGLVHELSVHQIELEMQNEELRSSREQLEQSRSEYAELYDFAPVGYLTFDKIGHITRANVTACGLFGIERNRLLKKPFALFVHPESQDLFYLYKQKVVGTTAPQTCELVLKRKDSAFFYAQLESIAVQVNGSAVIRTILTDVTERKQVEWKQKRRESQLRQVHEGQMVDEALRRSEEEFRVLAEHVPDVIERFDAGMRHVYVNPAGLRLRGKELDNIIGRTIREIGVPEPYCTFREDALRMVFATGEVSQVESNFQTVGGNGMRFYQSILVPEYDHEGNIAFVLVVSRDITERKSAEEALLTSQIHLSEAMDLAKIVYWELDSATRTFTLNDAFYTFYGTTAEQEGGYRMAAEEYFKRFVHPDDRAMVRQLAEENNSGKDPEFLVDLEHRIIRRDGEVRHILARTRGLRDVGGRITRCYGANQDITERKRHED